jgi:hypothetical protein
VRLAATVIVPVNDPPETVAEGIPITVPLAAALVKVEALRLIPVIVFGTALKPYEGPPTLPT